jgi:hypothetical protein
LNLCFKIKEKNSNKPNKNMNMIWIMRERWELSFKTN